MKKITIGGGCLVIGLMCLQFISILQAMEAPEKKVNNMNSKNDINNSTMMNTTNKFEFSALPYSYDGLEPYIDKLTVEIHYSKHHKTYYDNFMIAAKAANLESLSMEDIFKNISKYPTAVRNNGGGYYNHTFYWENMKPLGGGVPSGRLSGAINKAFGSFDEFKKQFTEAGKTRFGSGWVWLSIDAEGKLFISSTQNQDNPLMDIAEKKGIPILALDVWEHAYYLKYQNKRVDYLEAFWNVVNWEMVDSRYEKALK